MPKILDMESTDLRKSDILANESKKIGLFAKVSLAVVGACEVAKNPHIFLTRSNPHIEEINRHFDPTLNNFGPMVFVANQEQNES